MLVLVKGAGIGAGIDAGAGAGSGIGTGTGAGTGASSLLRTVAPDIVRECLGRLGLFRRDLVAARGLAGVSSTVLRDASLPVRDFALVRDFLPVCAGRPGFLPLLPSSLVNSSSPVLPALPASPSPSPSPSPSTSSSLCERCRCLSTRIGLRF